MKKGNNSGFTLVEVVVVVAVIAILAAVLTPYITKYIDDSKIAKARNECQVVAASVANFYKDIGQWPRTPRNGVGASTLYTGGSAPAAPNTYVNFVTGTAKAGWTNGYGLLDTHLSTNTPTPSAWPIIGDQRWNGPYAATPIPLDPWGRPYLVYIPPTAAGNAAAIWVISAGPNGTIDTLPAATSIINSSAVGGNDDIGIRIR